MNQLKALISKEIILEWRQKHSLNGVLLYSIATIFVCYLSFTLRGGAIPKVAWNALFWIIVLFASINAVAKSFVQENSGRSVYFYQISDPQALIGAKMIYSTLLIIVISLLSLLVYSILLGNPVIDLWMFLLVTTLGLIGIACTLTLISAISAKAGNNSMLMAVLSFPVLLPLLLSVIKATKNAMDGLARSESIDEILLLLSLDAIVIILALLLFPYLWRY